MQLFRRKDTGIRIVIVTGSCCIPGMAPFDQRARQIVDQAIVESGVTAHVRMMPASTAAFGGVPREVIAKLMGAFNQSGQIGLPAVLVNDRPVSYGVPELEKMKRELRQAAGMTQADPTQTLKEEPVLD